MALANGQPPPISNDRTEATLTAASSQGWQILSRDAAGVQFRKPKTWSKAAVWFGVILLIFWGIGLLVLLLAALDYALAKDKLAYVSASALAAGKGPAVAKERTSNAVVLLAIVFILIVFIGILGSSLK